MGWVEDLQRTRKVGYVVPEASESSPAVEQTEAPRARRRRRIESLDRLRGLAILLMVGDHLCIFAGVGGLGYRFTLGRAAMPLFFVISGFLVSRVGWRHAGIFAAGLALPLVVPWLDSPNVLCWYVIGAVVLELARRTRYCGELLALVVVVGLTMGANGYGLHGSSYEPCALLGLMALGQLLRRLDYLRPFEVAGDWLPRWFAVIGRRPLSWYVGQALVIEALVLVGVL